jgi:flagellar biosynthesis protein FliP
VNFRLSAKTKPSYALNVDLSLDAILTLICCSGFLRMLLVLSLLSFGLGLRGLDGGVLVVVLSSVLALTFIQNKFPDQNPGQLSADASSGVLLEKVSGSKETKLSTFVFSELTEGLKSGCLVLIPFLIIDLLIAHLLVLLSVVQIPALVISLPLKLLLFLVVDGWGLVGSKLLEARS